jgi:hypothetical protein
MNSEQIVKNEEPQGCLTEIGWLGMGFVMPFASLTFYRQATRRRVFSAILFFVLFTVVASTLVSLNIGRVLLVSGSSIRDRYESGTLPVITIKDGVASVDPPSPFVLLDQNGQVVIIDTTGQYKEIDRSRYYQGFLLAKTSLHVLSRGQYQVLPLSQLNTLFNKNPIVIDADTVSSFWLVVSIFIVLFIFFMLIIWNTVIRFMIITTIDVLLWGIASLLRPKTGFGSILIASLYALVPTVVLDYILGLVKINFIGLQTLLLLVFTVIVLIALLSKKESVSQPHTLRAWRSFIGIPFLIALAVSATFSWPKNPLFIWMVAILTIGVLAVVGYITHPKQVKPDTLID